MYMTAVASSCNNIYSKKIFGVERHTITIRLHKSGWRLHNGTLAIYCNRQYTVNPKDSLHESQKDISILRTVLKAPEACYREVSHCNVYMGLNAVHFPYRVLRSSAKTCMECTLTKIFSPYIQEVVAGCPTVLSLAPFSVPLCYQGVSQVTHQKDCTTIHWLII